MVAGKKTGQARTHECVTCGRAFTAYRSHTRYCSRACNARDWDAKHPEQATHTKQQYLARKKQRRKQDARKKEEENKASAAQEIVMVNILRRLATGMTAKEIVCRFAHVSPRILRKVCGVTRQRVWQIMRDHDKEAA